MTASGLDRVRALELAAHLDRDLRRAYTLERVYVSPRVRTRAAAIVDDLAIVRNLVNDLAADLDEARGTADLLANFGSHVDATGMWAVSARKTIHDLTEALQDLKARALACAYKATDDLARAEDCGGRVALRVAPAAVQLASAAARLLPAQERARYAEEFRSELWDIAQGGGGRQVQLAYAARLVMAAPHLRGRLRVPRRRGAVP